MEEERRLFYVAMTRARKHLMLFYAMQRFRYGSIDASSPSRFLKDIDRQYLNMPADDVRQAWVQRSAFDGDSKPVFMRRQEKPKLEQRSQPERKPWQKGNFQVVTDTMLNSAAPVSPGEGSLHEGNVIEHERFGIGSVLSVEGEGDNAKARIRFLNVGEKTLLLKFARYKILK